MAERESVGDQSHPVLGSEDRVIRLQLNDEFIPVLLVVQHPVVALLIRVQLYPLHALLQVDFR